MAKRKYVKKGPKWSKKAPIVALHEKAQKKPNFGEPDNQADYTDKGAVMNAWRTLGDHCTPKQRQQLDTVVFEIIKNS